MTKGTTLARQFYDVFDQQWRSVQEENLTKWHQEALWTEFMLGNSPANTDAKGGLLADCVSKYLECIAPKKERLIRREWDKIDLVGLTQYGDQNKWYETNLRIMIEHENRVDSTYDLESEFYKLLHWRAPLKVLVCYRKANPPEDKRYKDKQDLFAHMHHEICRLMGPDQAEYLMLVGGRDGKKKGFDAFHLLDGTWESLQLNRRFSPPL